MGIDSSPGKDFSTVNTKDAVSAFREKGSVDLEVLKFFGKVTNEVKEKFYNGQIPTKDRRGENEFKEFFNKIDDIVENKHRFNFKKDGSTITITRINKFIPQEDVKISRNSYGNEMSFYTSEKGYKTKIFALGLNPNGSGYVTTPGFPEKINLKQKVGQGFKDMTHYLNSTIPRR